MLPLQGVRIWSLVRELRFCMPHPTTNKQINNSVHFLGLL